MRLYNQLIRLYFLTSLSRVEVPLPRALEKRAAAT